MIVMGKEGRDVALTYKQALDARRGAEYTTVVFEPMTQRPLAYCHFQVPNAVDKFSALVSVHNDFAPWEEDSLHSGASKSIHDESNMFVEEEEKLCRPAFH